MKKILLLLTVSCFMGTLSFSQTDLQITSVVPVANTTYPEVTAGTTVDFMVNVTNMGPSNLNSTDTVLVSMSLDWLIPFTGYVLQSKLQASQTTLMTAGSSESFTFSFTQGVSLGQTPNGAAIVTVPNFTPINDIVFQVYGYTSSNVLLSDPGSDVVNGALVLSGNNQVNPQNVQFGQVPLNPEIEISADKDSICSGEAVMFTANVTNPGSNGIYTWKINGTSQGAGGSTFSTTTLNNNDEIDCDYTASVSGSNVTVSSNNLTEVVHANVIPTISVSVNPGTTVPENETVTFTANYSNGGPNPNFQWYKNQFPLSGQDNATLELLSGSDFQDGDEIEVAMQSDAPCADPSTITSDPISMAIQATGISRNNLIETATKVYPNPANDYIVVSNETLAPGNYSLRIVNQLGQTVINKEIKTQAGLQCSIDLQGMANGIYRVLIMSDHGLAGTQTFVRGR